MSLLAPMSMFDYDARPATPLDLCGTFFPLAKVLMPGFFTRDRPDWASAPRTKKAGDFPGANLASLSVVYVTRRSDEFHLHYP